MPPARSPGWSASCRRGRAERAQQRRESLGGIGWMDAPQSCLPAMPSQGLRYGTAVP